jgi:hypothetical protein
VSEALAKIQAQYLYSMKKLMFTLAFMLISTVVLANEKTTEIKSETRPDGVVLEEIQNSKQDEALHCKVTWPNGTKYECWFCSCADLPKPAVLEKAVQ